MYHCSMVLMLHICLDSHLVTLYAQILLWMELITTICGMNMSDIQHSVIEVCYEHAVEVWY